MKKRNLIRNKQKKPSRKSVDFEPNKVTFAVVCMAVVSLVLIAVIASS